MSTFRAEVYPVVLDDTRHVLDVDTGCTITDMVPAERHAIVVVNNRILAPDEYPTCHPIEGDYVVIRTVPTGLIVGAIAAVGASAAAGAAAASVTFLGLTGFAAAAAWTAVSIGVTVIGALIQRSLIEPPKTPDQVNPNRLPGISGQSNQIDPFGVIDTVYGTVRTIPKLGGKPYTEVAGDDQFLRMLFVVGHGPLAFDESDIDIGDTPLTNYDDYTIEIRNGYADDAPVTLFKNVVDETNPNVPLNDNADEVIRTTAENTTRISIDLVAQGLAQRQSDGSGTSTVMVAYDLEYRVSGGTWIPVPINDTSGNVRLDPTSGFPNYTFGTIGDTLDTVRFNVSADVPEGQYDVRLKRVAARQLAPVEGIDDKLGITDMSWSALRSFVANDGAVIKYPGPLALIALRIRASDQLNGIIDQLSVKCRSVIEIPGQGPEVTDNPGWLMRDVLTGNSAKTAVETSRIADLSSFATFCADRGYAFNAVVQPGDRYSVAAQILSLGRGSIDMSDGRFGVVYEHAQNARQMFTPRNSWNFSGNRKFTKIPHAFRTQYLDPETWEANEVIVYRDGYNKTTATRFEKFDLTYGCTDVDQAVQMTHEKLREIVLRPEAFRLTTDIEYLAVGRGGRVKHAHDAILVGLGSARITAIDTDNNTVSFDQTYEMTVGRDYGIEVRDDQSQVYAVPVATSPGSNRTVTITEPLPSRVAVGDLVAFGETSKITQDLIVKFIDVGADREATLELIPYAPDIYDLGEPPEYDSHITQPIDPHRVPPVIPVIGAVRYDQDVGKKSSSGSIITQIVVNYQLPSSNAPAVDKVQVSYRRTDGSFRIVESGVGNSITIADVQEGSQYEIRIRSVSIYGVPSAYSASVFHNVPGVVPLPPTGVDVEIGTFSITLNPRGGSASTVWEFWRSTADLTNIEDNATYIATTTALTDPDLTPDTLYYYYIREVNAYGVSDFLAIQATTQNEPNARLKYATDAILDGPAGSNPFATLARGADDIRQDVTTLSDTVIDPDTGDANFATVETVSQVAATADAAIARYAIKVTGQTTDGHPVSGQIVAGANGETADLILDFDRLLVGRVNGAGVAPFVLDADGNIIANSALIESLTIGKLVDDAGTVIVENGQIKAEYINVDNLQVNYSAVFGPKPPVDADKTNYDDRRITNIIEDQGQTIIANPNGGTTAYDGSKTGAIKVVLPNGYINSMISIDINVYNYQQSVSPSFKITAGGFLYSVSGGSWESAWARIMGATDADNTVRFGQDGTTGNCCVWIGEIDSVWDYPKIAVENIIISHENFERELWDSGWLVSFDGSFSSDRINASISDNLLDANDTKFVSGTDSATVRDNASAAKSRVDDWTRPGETKIWGNQISTADAYVDTLQIKGHAVTFPQSGGSSQEFSRVNNNFPAGTWVNVYDYSLIPKTNQILVSVSPTFACNSQNHDCTVLMRIRNGARNLFKGIVGNIYGDTVSKTLTLTRLDKSAAKNSINTYYVDVMTNANNTRQYTETQIVLTQLKDV